MSQSVDNRAMLGAGCGIGAAALFGASAPLSKLILGQVGPLMLSALLYLGAAAGLAMLKIASRRTVAAREAQLRGVDFATLALITILGLSGTFLMLYGLTRISALAGSLLLNLETPFTMLIAVMVLGEYLGIRETLAALAIMVGAMLLGWAPGGFHSDPIGSGAIAAACLCWAIDNNLTQRLSIRDPAAITYLKSLGAGVATLTIAFALGLPLPTAPVVGAALAIGAVCYGLSLYLATWGLRILGAARQAAYFATAPFIGAAISMVMFRNLPGTAEWCAAALMALGAIVLLREDHRHLHAHDELTHDHLHYHDAHHQHRHAPDDEPVSEPHAHPHRHLRLLHSHQHVSDIHHRHSHGKHPDEQADTDRRAT
ncbi:MAG TPA: EamA family transporter [Candidatus Binataceae bacterium]|nr:EamA family transporter [Candidatus Binataceae bacterium]